MFKQFRVSYGVLAALLVGACSVPPVDFTPPADAGDDTTDAMPDTPEVVELQVSTNAVTVAEAGTMTFSVQLTAAPTGTVLVSIDSADDNRVGVAPTSIQFDSTNWNTARTVTLSGREDADTEDEAVNVTASSTVGNETIAVTVTDNDELAIIVTPADALQVNEGASSTLAVHLSAQPSGPISVTVMSSDTAVATVSPTTLTFGTGTWDVAQNVVVSAPQDLDTVDGTADVMLSATGATGEVVPITVNDDDILGIVTSTTNLGALTEGDTASFTVALTRQPPGNVSVAVSSSDTMVLTVSPTPLAFTPANWNTPQTVNVALPQDVDTANETATISLMAATLTTRTVTAQITDNDMQTVVAAPDPVAVDEGMSRPLNVHLEFQPSADITLTVTSLNTGVATVSSPTLTFTPANYATNQTVTVSAPEDADVVAGMTAIRLESLPDQLVRDVAIAVTDNDQLLIETSTTTVTLGEAGTATFGVRLTAMPGASVSVGVASGDATAATVSPAMLTFTTANYATYQTVTVTGVSDNDLAHESLTLTLTAAGLLARTVDASVTDDDMQTVVVSAPTIQIGEGGTGQIGVSLGFMPAANVTVNLASLDTTAATVAPAMLTFTPANYATPQNATITGAQDADAVNDATMVNATATGATPAAVAVTVVDDEQLGIETSVANLNVNEPGTATFGVRLTAQPAADTTVVVMSSDVAAATAAPAMLTFTTGNYNTFQNVTLTGVADADGINDTLTVNLSSPPLTARTVNVTVVDDDTQDILLTTNAITVGESGNGTFGVHLASMPASDVVVSVASADTNKATASPAMLTFTPANYATNQTVTVSGAADLNLSNETVLVNMTSPGVPTRAVTVTVNDDDMQVVESSTTGTVNLTEGGTGVAVGFKLRYQPAANTTVTLTLGTGLSVAGGNTLTFTPANYSVEQTKTISGAQDADAVDVTTTVTASAPGATSATVNVFVDDDDSLTLEVSTLSVGVTEGSTAQFGVRLTAQPTADTTVMVASSDANVATINAGATLTFTTANYGTYQNVTVGGVQDPDVQTEGANVTVSSTGLASRNVGVTVTDDDILTIITTVGAVAVNEGGTGTFGVRLSHQPSAPITVTVASSATAVMQVTTGASLVFDTANYAVNQNVVVSGTVDADLVDASATANLQAAGLSPTTVTVNVADRDFTLTDLSDQMGPDAGAEFVSAFGTGFNAAMTGTMNGNAVTSVQAPTSTQLDFRTPARSANGSRWSDLRLTKAGNTQMIPRAYHYGGWEDASSGMNGGYAGEVVSYSATTNLYALVENNLFRSTNGGAAWTRLDLSSVGGGASRMAAHPTDSQTFYLLSYSGPVATTNGGASYTPIGSFTSASCLGLNPGQPSHLYLCDGNRLMRSVDSGANWTEVATIMPAFTAVPSWNGSTAYMATRDGVVKTTNSGVTWTNASGNLANMSVDVVAVSPANAQIALAGIPNAGIYRTTDGGSQWALTTGGPTSAIEFAFVGSTVYAATEAGVYKSTDGGASWSAANGGFPAKAHSLRGISARTASEVYLASGSHAVWKTTNGGQSWTRSDGGMQATSPTQIVAHPTTSGTVYAVTNAGFYKSTNSGASWTLSESGIPQDSNIYEVGFMPGTPYTMYAAAGQALYRSTDSGTTWTPAGITTGSPQNFGFDASNPQHLYVFLSSGGTLQRSTDAGMTFQPFNAAGLPAQFNLGRFVRSGSAMLVFEYNSNSWYRYSGTAWVAAGTGAPSTVVNLFGAPNGHIYAGDFSNLYRSTDGGATFSLFLSGYSSVFWDPNRAQTAFLWRSYSGPERTLTSTTTRSSFNDGVPQQSQWRGSFAMDSNGTTVYTTVTARGVYRITD